MKIASKVPGLRVRSSFPNFNYYFEEADVPLEVEESHTEKILKNSNFYESDKIPKKVNKTPQKPWKEELSDINGIGKKTVEDIISVYPDKEMLINDLKTDAKIPFRDDVCELLKKFN
jgi:hypothetical protein